jgi:hypothetical protein
MSGASSGGHRSKGRNNSGSSHHNGSQPASSRASRGLLSSQQSTTRSCSPTTTLSNNSSSKKSNNSFSHNNNNSNNNSSNTSKQQQQQQQQLKQTQQQNPPSPPLTVTVNSNNARRYASTTNSSPQQQQHPTNMMSPLASTTLPQQQPVSKKMDILKVLAEVEGGSFQVTWRECFWITVALAFLAMCSIAVGIAAGMTISIHYYGQEIRVLPKQKATMLDPAIALTNVMMMKATTTIPASTTATTGSSNNNHLNLKNTKHGNNAPSLPALDLGRVITTSKSGQRDMLSVVEELPPLPNDEDDEQEDCTPATPGSQPQQQQQQEPALPPIRSMLNFSQPTVLPKLCKDGETWGFDDWYTLRKAIQEANALSAERFMKWNEYMAKYSSQHHHQYHYQQRQTKQQQQRQQQQEKPNDADHHLPQPDDDDDDDWSFWYYQDEVVFTVCPNAVLTARKRSPPIFINAEHVRLECPNDNCLIAKPGTHLNFGRHAQDVWIRGITFAPSTKLSRRAATYNVPASLTFYQDGAMANFHDCVWLNYQQQQQQQQSSNTIGHKANIENHPYSFYSWFAPATKVLQPEPLWATVADINSSSTVNFYRCRIGMEDATSVHYPTSRSSRSSYRL